MFNVLSFAASFICDISALHAAGSNREENLIILIGSLKYYQELRLLRWVRPQDFFLSNYTVELDLACLIVPFIFMFFWFLVTLFIVQSFTSNSRYRKF